MKILHINVRMRITLFNIASFIKWNRKFWGPEMSGYIFCGKDILLKENGELPLSEDLDFFKSRNSDAVYFEEAAWNLKVLGLKNADELPAGFKKIMLREYFASHNEEENFLAARAKGLYEWKEDCKFCCSCGTLLQDHPTLTARQCPECGKLIFPRISPCIIVVVHKDGKILLARHTYRNQDMYACIAGFMEAGESAEHAVAREVLEETGLKIKNIKYRCSQSWPFPDQLMLGYTADWESGKIKVQEEEIAEAKWFDVNNLPNSPKPGSIAYKLIHGEW